MTKPRFAIINANGILWGDEIYDSEEDARKDLKSLLNTSTPKDFEIVSLEVWQCNLITALNVSYARNHRLTLEHHVLREQIFNVETRLSQLIPAQKGE